MKNNNTVKWNQWENRWNSIKMSARLKSFREHRPHSLSDNKIEQYEDNYDIYSCKNSALYSTYLAMYDGVLTWTISKHITEEEWDNMATYSFIDEFPNKQRYTKNELFYCASEIIKTYLSDICRDKTGKRYFASYSHLMLFIDENFDSVEEILAYDDFAVVKIEGRFFYYENCIEGEASDFYEVEIVAELRYDVNHDLTKQDQLYDLFSCDCCGEYVHGEGISYLWFKEVVDDTKLLDTDCQGKTIVYEHNIVATLRCLSCGKVEVGVPIYFSNHISNTKIAFGYEFGDKQYQRGAKLWTCECGGSMYVVDFIKEV